MSNKVSIGLLCKGLAGKKVNQTIRICYNAEKIQHVFYQADGDGKTWKGDEAILREYPLIDTINLSVNSFLEKKLALRKHKDVMYHEVPRTPKSRTAPRVRNMEKSAGYFNMIG